MRRKLIETATSFVEPGETIGVGVSVVRGSNLMLRLRAAAMLMSRVKVVAVTGENIYILAVDLTGSRCKRLEQRHPLGSIEVRVEPGLEQVASPRPAILGIPGSGADHVIRSPGKLHVSDQRFWFRSRDANDAWAVVKAIGH